MNTTLLLTVIGTALLTGGLAAVCHYRLLRRLHLRVHLMREAIHNRDFTFQLPVRGLFASERALQRTLNELSKEAGTLVAQNEVESWQKLTRVLTHEIMNATTPIVSISQAYLQQPDLQGTPYEEGIRAIYETSTGLSAFIDSYRKLTQLQEPLPGDVPLLPFIDNLKALYPSLQWHTGVPAHLHLTTDPGMLRQVLMNLLKNAQEAGATEVDFRWDNGLQVSNNGRPIPAETAREMFIPFFTTKRTGSGIGLSLSRQLMVTLGGQLALADTPVGGYPVTFVLTFPE